MTPLWLRLQAFGPFANTHVIDFKILGKNPLFLINGATGAGKTTLLDAICFSLYGRTSGNERDATQMRCDFSVDEILTEVEFIFFLRDKTYKVLRLPQQSRKKSRGEGIIQQAAEASLWLLKGDKETLLAAKSTRQVDQILLELMGLNADQFRQVMVLPQGKFREFLLADSNQREKIFSQLFQTQIYYKIEQKLKDSAQKVKAEYERLKKNEAEIFTQNHIGGLDAFDGQIETLIKECSEIEIQRNIAQESIELATKQLTAEYALSREFQELARLQQQSINLNGQAEVCAADKALLLLAEKADALKPLYESMNDTRQKLLQAKTIYEQSQQALKEAKSKKNNIVILLKKASAEAAKIPEAREVLNHQKQLFSVLGEWRQLLQSHSELVVQKKVSTEKESMYQTELNNIKLYIEQLEKEERTLAGEINELARLEVEKLQLNETKNKLQQCDEINKALILKDQQKDKLEATGKALRIDVEQHQKQVIASEYSWHHQQAAMLASQLAPEHPCPVCGSKNHPSPAVSKSGTLIDKEHLDFLKSELDAKQEALRSVREEYRAILAECQTQTDTLNNLSKQLENHNQIDFVSVVDRMASVDERLRILNLDQIRLLEVRRESDEFKEKLKSLQETFFEQQKENIKITTQINQQKNQIEKIEKTLPEHWREGESLQNAILFASQQLMEWEANLESARLENNQAEIDFVQCQEREMAAEKAYADHRSRWDNLNDQWQSTLLLNGWNATEDYEQAIIAPELQEEIRNRINIIEVSRNKNASILDAQNAKLKDILPPNLTIIEEQVVVKKREFNEKNNLWQQKKTQEDQLLYAKKQLLTLGSQLLKLSEEYQLVGTLSDYASGKTGNKVSLQRFVLGVLLDDVLIEASERLLKMSRGRYRLLRKLEKASRGSASGLELLVEDSYTGHTRAAATLSGGESFLAALALALGLSDVVQAHAGGIQLDALFIDEGFGSLDQEALDLAIRTLIDLQASGKMIGIISHVTELKEQLALRIDIEASVSGSQIRIVS